jgi:hypothetical protein
VSLWHCGRARALLSDPNLNSVQRECLTLMRLKTGLNVPDWLACSALGESHKKPPQGRGGERARDMGCPRIQCRPCKPVMPGVKLAEVLSLRVFLWDIWDI